MTMTAKQLTPVTRRGRKHLSLGGPLEDAVFPGGVFFQLDESKNIANTLPPLPFGRRPSLTGPLKDLDSTVSDPVEHTETTTSTSTPCTSPPTSWKSTENNSFLLHQPLLVSDPETNECITDEAEALGQVMKRSRNLPGTWYYSSNHVMVNQERTKRVMAPLYRLSELDAIARQHASAMAQSERLFHSDPVQLHSRFQRPSRRMGENVACGANIRDIHKEMMNNKTDKANILHRRYTHFGMGTAQSKDGKLYLCQVFRG